MLLAFGRSGLPAGAIASRMAILPSSLSFHLRQMTQAGILVQRRSSRQIIYAVNQEIMGAVVEFLTGALRSAVGGSDEPEHVVGNGDGQASHLGAECDGIALGFLQEESEYRGFGL